MPKLNVWTSLKLSVKAAKPYYGWIPAYYLLLLLIPLWALLIYGIPPGLSLIGIITSAVLLVAVLSHLYVMYRKRQPAILFMTLASPFCVIPVISIILAIGGYITGTARVQTGDIIGSDKFGQFLFIERLNIDPIARCTMGKATYMNAVPLYFLTSIPYNATVRGLSAAIGPMPGAYRGPYPPEAMAQQFLAQHATTWTQQQLSHSQVRLDGMRTTLPGKDILTILADLPSDMLEFWQVGQDNIDLAVFSPECLILRYKTERSYTVIALVDLQRRTVFARYFKKPLDS